MRVSDIQPLRSAYNRGVCLCVTGQQIGSLQAVRESLRRVKWKQDRLQPGSSSSSIGLPALRQVAGELFRYVLGEDSHFASQSMTQEGDGEKPGMNVNPKLLATSLQHQQMRAQVHTNQIIMHLIFS